MLISRIHKSILLSDCSSTISVNANAPKLRDRKLMKCCTVVEYMYIVDDQYCFVCISIIYLFLCFYALFLCPVYGHYVFWSVRPLFFLSFVHLFVRPSVPHQVKVFVWGSFWWSWRPINLKLSTHVPYDMVFLI